MAKNIANGTAMPINSPSQQSVVQTAISSVNASNVKKALASSVTQNVAQAHRYTPPTDEVTDSSIANNKLQNIYLNQQIYNNKNNKFFSLENYQNGTNNDLNVLIQKINHYNIRGTRLTKSEIDDLHDNITALKTNKYTYSSKEIKNLQHGLKNLNKAHLAGSKIVITFTGRKEIKSGFKTRTKLDVARRFQSAPQTIGNVLKGGLDDVKHELEYKGNGEKEALVLTGALSITAISGAWKEKSRNLVAQNFSKDADTYDNINSGVKKIFSKNERFKAKYIDNGHLLTGFRNTRNSANDIIKSFAPNAKLKINFNDAKSVKKYTNLLDDTAQKLGLEKNLSGYSKSYLENLLKDNGTTENQKVIIDAILSMKNLDNLKDTAIVDHMKEMGVDTKLTKINYNNKRSVNFALGEYSRYFNKIGMTDYTKMSHRKLKIILKKNPNISTTQKNMINDILMLKKHQQFMANKKMVAKTSSIKAYALLSKIMGNSDFMQGAQTAMQVVMGVKTALVAANVARKVLGRTNKFIGRKTYKLASGSLKKTEKGTKIISKIDKNVLKYNKLKSNVKSVPHNLQRNMLHIKSNATNKIKNTKAAEKISSAKNKISSHKAFNNKATSVAKKLSKNTSKAISGVFEKLLSAFNFLNKLKLYIIAGIGLTAIGIYFLYAILLPFANNSSVSMSVEMEAQVDEHGNAITDENGNPVLTYTETVEDSIFGKVFTLLEKADNKWFTDLDNIKTRNPGAVINDANTGDANASAFFNNGDVTGYWNPNNNKLFTINSFGTNDTDADGNEINDGTYYSYVNGDGSVDGSQNSVSKHSNIKMCMSLAHGFINADYENYSNEFREFAMGLWDNSHEYHTKLMKYNKDVNNPYIYPCISGDGEFDYECTEAIEILNQASDNNSSIKVITSDINNSDYSAIVKDTLVRTEDGCQVKTHKNNGSKGFILYDNVLNETIKDTTSDGLAINVLVSYTYTTPEFTVYYKDIHIGNKTGTKTLTDITTLYRSSTCSDYTITETGTYNTKYCNDSLLTDIKGCVSLSDPSHCGTYQKTLEGNFAYVNSVLCANSTHHSFSHGKKLVTVTEKKLVSLIPLVWQDVEVTKEVLDPDCDINIAGVCLRHYWYECNGHVDAYCPGHSIPEYKIQCNGHYECVGHTAEICSGHVDIDVTSTIIGLDENNNLYSKEMWDDGEIDDDTFNFYNPNYDSFQDLCEKVYGEKDSPTNPKINEPEDNFEGYIWDSLNGVFHWTDDMEGYTEEIYNSDWYKIYGLAAAKIETKIRLSQGEIDEYIDIYYPCDIKEYAKNPDYHQTYNSRKKILTRALTAINRIPYYPGGTSDELQVALDANNFGSVVRGPDGLPVIKYNGTAALYLKGLDESGFVRWATTLSNTNVNTSINTSKKLNSISEAQPGDIIKMKYTNSYAIYLGQNTNGTVSAVQMAYPANSQGNVSIVTLQNINILEFYQSVY